MLDRGATALKQIQLCCENYCVSCQKTQTLVGMTHPSISLCISMIGSQRQQIQKGSPDVPLPSNTPVLLLGDPVKISPARSESAQGFPQVGRAW